MNVNTAAGEQVLDALLLLGYWVKISDDGAIEWSDRSAIFRMT